MTNPAGNPMDAVASLMLERQRYEAWISQLESRRAITPPHVFERVRADYERRLREVTSQLAGRTSEVQGTMTALTERLARLQSEETTLRDQRYEQELRSHVGEITNEQWAKVEKDHDDRLGRIATERGSITGEIARLQQMLSMAGHRDGASVGDGASASGADGRAAGGDAKRRPGFDELEFLKSVTDDAKGGSSKILNGPAGLTPTPAEPMPGRLSASIPTIRSGATPARSTSVQGEKKSTPSGSGDSSAGVRSPLAQSGSFPADSSGNLPPSDREQNKASEEAAKAEKEPEEVPAFLRDVPQEQTKTLRCGDCSAMNFPTEWYCERCGAELAGM
jgi:hypothetical protein